MFKVITLATILVIVAAKHCNKDGMCNVAHGGTAGQTTTVWGGTAGRAIDGRTSGKYSDRSCTHTHRQQVNKWWVELQGIALGYTYPIDTVVIYNRQDCCSSRLNGAKVIAQLGKDGETKECGTVQLEDGVSRYSFNCNDFEADRVMVLLNKNYLTLCEVEVLVKQASMPESKHDNVALEGKTSGSYRDNTCTHSRTNKNNKWSVILKGSLAGAKYPIDKVIIYNRQDCCSDRLKGAKVWVGDQLCGEIMSPSSVNVIDCEGKLGGIVSVSQDTQFLTLCEVEVYVKESDIPENLPEYTNVALEGTASQSSEGWGGKAERAIDGNTSGNYNSRSCTHSRYNKNNWWKVALSSTTKIASVLIYNRQDCCQNRIDGAQVWVDGTKCGDVKYDGSSVYQIDCSGAEGESVIVKQDKNILTLCEVEVYTRTDENPSEETDE